MSRHVLGSVVLVTVFAIGHAPQAESRQQTPAPAERPAAAQGKPTPGPSEAPPPPVPQGQPVNIKLDLTITDQAGPGQPAKKTVSVIVADRGNAAVRSSGNDVRATINVDASPQIMGNGNVRLILGVEYNPRQGPAEKIKGPGGEMMEAVGDARGSSLNQRVMVLLEPNKPLIISQAADPLSDRKITLEIKATILR
jgi:hypothetical protein